MAAEHLSPVPRNIQVLEEIDRSDIPRGHVGVKIRVYLTWYTRVMLLLRNRMRDSLLSTVDNLDNPNYKGNNSTSLFDNQLEARERDMGQFFDEATDLSLRDSLFTSKKFSALFLDVDFYQRRYDDAADSNSLSHWMLFGQKEGRSPHPLIDTDFYRFFNPDVLPGDELRHYLEFGWLEGRSISPFVQTDFFREANPGWVGLGISPIEYLCSQLHRGEDISTGLLSTAELPEDMGKSPLSRLRAYVLEGLGLPSIRAVPIGDVNPLSDCRAEVTAEDLEIDASSFSVVIPLYADHPVTRQSLERLSLIAQRGDWDIVLVLDGATDTAFVEFVMGLGNSQIKVRHNTRPHGFSAAVNQGIALCGVDRDVVILNSDVLIRPKVFELLEEALLSNPDLASVTAVSNFGSLASYPLPGRETRWLPMSPDKLSEFFERDKFRDLVTPTPTCIGHCVIIRRSALDEVGMFNSDLFPEGYGEEVDWSIRASKLGWHHGISNRAFVWHQGSVSFGGRKTKLKQRGETILKELHGETYAQMSIDVARTKKLLENRFRHLECFLFRSEFGQCKAVITHSMGGGTFEFLDRQVVDHDEVLFIFLDESSAHFRISSPGFMLLPVLEFAKWPLEILGETLESLGLSEVQVHSGVSADSELYMNQLFMYKGNVDYVLHDYSPYCPRVNLVGGATAIQRFCGAPVSNDICQTCVNIHGSRVGTTSIKDLRTSVDLAFRRARHLYVPHDSGKEIWRRWGIETRSVVHSASSANPRRGATQKRRNSVMALEGSDAYRRARLPSTGESRPRVLVPGRISLAKGAALLRDVLLLNRIYGSPIEFMLCGEFDPSIIEDVKLFGSIATDYVGRLPDLALQVHFDAVWISSIWPETYMYVLDDLRELPTKQLLYFNCQVGAPSRRSSEVGFQQSRYLFPDATQILRQMISDLVK